MIGPFSGKKHRYSNLKGNSPVLPNRQPQFQDQTTASHTAAPNSHTAASKHIFSNLNNQGVIVRTNTTNGGNRNIYLYASNLKLDQDIHGKNFDDLTEPEKKSVLDNLPQNNKDNIFKKMLLSKVEANNGNVSWKKNGRQFNLIIDPGSNQLKLLSDNHPRDLINYKELLLDRHLMRASLPDAGVAIPTPADPTPAKDQHPLEKSYSTNPASSPTPTSLLLSRKLPLSIQSRFSSTTGLCCITPSDPKLINFLDENQKKLGLITYPSRPGNFYLKADIYNKSNEAANKLIKIITLHIRKELLSAQQLYQHALDKKEEINTLLHTFHETNHTPDSSTADSVNSLSASSNKPKQTFDKIKAELKEIMMTGVVSYDQEMSLAKLEKEIADLQTKMSASNYNPNDLGNHYDSDTLRDWTTALNTLMETETVFALINEAKLSHNGKELIENLTDKKNKAAHSNPTLAKKYLRIIDSVAKLLGPL